MLCTRPIRAFSPSSSCKHLAQVSRPANTTSTVLRIATTLLPRSQITSPNNLNLTTHANLPASTTRTFFTKSSTTSPTMASATSFYTFTPKDKKGGEYPLSQHTGKVVLAVNTASKCGFTPQYAGLETLYKKIRESNPEYKDDFVILGFPCNQFGGQDPGDNDTIQNFCQVNYGVSFPVLGKTEVNGNTAEPVWEWMKTEKPGLMGLKRIKWNFEKFLIGRDGKVVNRWASTSTPSGLESDILKELAKQKPASL